MATGTVKWFNATKGFGFIQPESGGKDVSVHISAVERAGLNGLRDGARIQYEIESDRQGRSSASQLQLLDGGASLSLPFGRTMSPGRGSPPARSIFPAMFRQSFGTSPGATSAGRSLRTAAETPPLTAGRRDPPDRRRADRRASPKGPARAPFSLAPHGRSWKMGR